MTQAHMVKILVVDDDQGHIELVRRNLRRAGISVRVRVNDAVQYEGRRLSYDFDMIQVRWDQSLSPGNEQRDDWGSAAAATPGSRNVAGIKDPVIDKLIDLVISAPDRKSLVTRTQALDRVLLWSNYVIPQWHINMFRVVYWDKFGRPAVSPKYALGFDTWWVDTQKEAVLARRKGEISK